MFSVRNVHVPSAVFRYRFATTSEDDFIGRALVSTHDYHKAIEYYVTALRNTPDNVALRHDLAKLFTKLRRFEPAAQVLQHALAPQGAPPTELPALQAEVQSLLLLGEVYRQNEDGQPAEEPIARAADLGVVDAAELGVRERGAEQQRRVAREAARGVAEERARRVDVVHAQQQHA